MMVVFALIFLVVITGVIVDALGWWPEFDQTSPPHTGQSPAEILKARYARGEIDREEYDQIRRDLEG